jgi:hypothetical protein
MLRLDELNIMNIQIPGDPKFKLINCFRINNLININKLKISYLIVIQLIGVN